MRIASPIVRADFDTWTARALVDITSRDELHGLLQTRKGLFSVYHALSECAVMGIQFGGHFPQAYLMPEGETAELDITWEGMAHIAAYGPGAVLSKAPMLIRVYEQDHFGGINQAAGTVEHTYDPRFPGKRGKLCGWYMILEYRDGSREVPYVNVEKVRNINENYSKKKTTKGYDMPAWKKSPEEMEDKTAAKQLLKKPAKTSEGLAMALSADAGPREPPEPPSPDVSVRVTGRMADVVAAEFTEGAQAEPPKTEKPPAQPSAPPPAPEKGKADKPEEKELF